MLPQATAASCERELYKNKYRRERSLASIDNTAGRTILYSIAFFFFFFACDCVNGHMRNDVGGGGLNYFRQYQNPSKIIFRGYNIPVEEHKIVNC